VTERNRKAAIGFIFITVLIDVLSFGVIIPILPKLIKEFAGEEISRVESQSAQPAPAMAGQQPKPVDEAVPAASDTTASSTPPNRKPLNQETERSETSKAAIWYGTFGFVFALMHFFFSPILGALSDRFGRRPVLLLSCFGLGIDYIIMALAPSLSWLFIGRVLSGITSASFATAIAYIADITPPEHRAARFGVIGAAFGLGFVIGPAVGGALGAVDLRYPFWLAASLALTNWLYGLFVLPESLSVENRKPFSWARANPIGSLKLLRSHPELFGLAAVQFFYFLAHVVLPSTFVLYTSYRYGWSELMTGSSLAAVGIFNILVQGFLVRKAVKRYGERFCLILALVTGIVGLTAFGLASYPIILWLALPVFAFLGFFQPSVQGLMTHLVKSDEQGQLQGASGSIQGIAGMVGPILFSGTFSFAISKTTLNFEVPGAPFFVAALLLFSALMIVLFKVKTDSTRESKSQPASNPSTAH
jgi:MFS transporter, DHA1 family, tetracycline resistance protein